MRDNYWLDDCITVEDAYSSSGDVAGMRISYDFAEDVIKKIGMTGNASDVLDMCNAETRPRLNRDPQKGASGVSALAGRICEAIGDISARCEIPSEGMDYLLSHWDRQPQAREALQKVLKGNNLSEKAIASLRNEVSSLREFRYLFSGKDIFSISGVRRAIAAEAILWELGLSELGSSGRERAPNTPIIIDERRLYEAERRLRLEEEKTARLREPEEKAARLRKEEEKAARLREAQEIAESQGGSMWKGVPYEPYVMYDNGNARYYRYAPTVTCSQCEQIFWVHHHYDAKAIKASTLKTVCCPRCKSANLVESIKNDI